MEQKYVNNKTIGYQMKPMKISKISLNLAGCVQIKMEMGKPNKKDENGNSMGVNICQHR